MPKNLFRGDPGFRHGETPAVGLLVVNLGTPAAPTAQALRPYLKQFLWDPRVIEMSRPLWWLILHLFILTRRPKESAKLYRRVWTDQGSPLLVFSKKITAALEVRLGELCGSPVHAALGMTYGEPSIPRALADLRDRGCRRIVVLPLYPHYSSTSTGAVFDAVMKELMTWRWVPEIRTIQQFHDEPALISALATTVRELWEREGEPDKLLMSFHGTPRRYFLAGDPYHCFCHKTARLLAEELELDDDRYLVTFQSLFGKEVWLKPYTDETLESLPARGTKKVDVICPGFSIDCLETLDEIGRESRKVFLEAGGEQYRYIPALNDRPEHLDFLVELVRRNLGDWVVDQEAWDGDAAKEAAAASRDRAEALRRAGHQGS